MFSEVNFLIPFNNRSIASIEIQNGLTTNESTTIDMAYTYHQNQDSNHIQIVNLIYENIPVLQQFYDSQFQSTSVGNKIVKESLIQLFPNPTTHLLNIKLENPQTTAFEVLDIYGKKVFEKADSFNSNFQLPLEHLSEGIYFLKVKMDGEEVVQKFIKI